MPREPRAIARFRGASPSCWLAMCLRRRCCPRWVPWLGMIPQGLVLLTSSVLAIATVRLARRKVLAQQLYCIETLARVDVLCLDKTGTITSGPHGGRGHVSAAG